MVKAMGWTQAISGVPEEKDEKQMEEKRITEVFERTASTGKECVKDHSNKIQDDGLPNTTLQGAKCSARSTSIMVYG